MSKKKKPKAGGGSPKTKTDPRFDLNSALQCDAAEIVAARTLGQVAHRVIDIDTAGSEVEEAVRAVLARRLPGAVAVEHGHLVDATLAPSPQIDVAVVAPTDLIRLMRNRDGTAYIPCESVYAVGEVKTTFDKKHVRDFSDTLDKVHKLARGRNPLQPSSRQHYQFGNPLYSFMLFVRSEADPFDDLKGVFGELAASNKMIPDAVCILDRGLVLNCTLRQDAKKGERVGNINVLPAFARDGERAWCLMPFGEDGFREGAHLGVLVALLIEHVSSCSLFPPDLFRYMRALFTEQTYRRLDQ